MKPSELKSGDVILVDGTSPVSDAIAFITDCRWTHVAMFVDGVVYEMDWPRCKGTPLADWLKANGKYVLGVVPLSEPLLPRQETAVETWWLSRIGMKYDWGLLLIGMAPATLWQRFALAIGCPKIARINPPASTGVCSSNVAWAWQAAGLTCTETTGMSPADCLIQPFVGPVQFLVVE